MKKFLRGFTLVELMVVVAIIGIISLIGLISFSAARQQTRDTRRLTDVTQIQNALQSYKRDEGRYPAILSFGGTLTGTTSTAIYMQAVPLAPVPADGVCRSLNDYIYSPSADGSSYSLRFCLAQSKNDLPAGPLCATPAGIATGNCSGMTYIYPYFSRDYGMTSAESLFAGVPTSDGGYVAVGASTGYSGPLPGASHRWIVKVGPDFSQQWQKGYVVAGYEYASVLNGVQTAPDGGYVVDGDKTVYYAPSDSRTVGWIAKLDASGTVIWEVNYSAASSTNGLAEFLGLRKSQDGNYLAFGESSDNDPEYSYNGTTYDPTDGVFVKYDGAGNELWRRSFGALKDQEWIADAVQLSDGSWALLMFTVGQNFTWAAPVYSNTLIKTDANGNELWRKTLGVNLDVFNSLALTADGGYLIGGGRVTSYNMLTATTHVSYLKVDASGNQVWRKDLTEGNYSITDDIAASDDGGCLIGFQADYTGGFQYQAVFLKTDSAGNETWRKLYGLPDKLNIYGLEKVPDGYLATGVDRTGTYGGQDGWIMHTDSSGNYQ